MNKTLLYYCISVVTSAALKKCRKTRPIPVHRDCSFMPYAHVPPEDTDWLLGEMRLEIMNEQQCRYDPTNRKCMSYMNECMRMHAYDDTTILRITCKHLPSIYV